jgi:hypothetical protein
MHPSTAYPSTAKERRFVLRLYEYWQTLRAERDMPSLAQWDFDAMGEDANHCLVLAIDPADQSATLARLGSELSSATWTGEPGTPVSAFPDDEAVAQIRIHLPEPLERKIPISRGGYFQAAGRRVLGRCILLPLSDDGVAVTHVVAGVNYKDAPKAPSAKAYQKKLAWS